MTKQIAKVSRTGRDLGKLTKRAEAEFCASRTDENYRALLALVDAWEVALSNWRCVLEDRIAARVEREAKMH